MKVLIGIDDSEQSRQAVTTMRSLPWPAGTKALVVSVVRPFVAGYPDVYASVSAELMAAEEQVRAHQRELAQHVQRELEGAGLSIETRVPDGDPRSVLVDLARSENVDLVVVGSHGRAGLTKLLLGSVASHVVTHAPCSVLVVKQHPA